MKTITCLIAAFTLTQCAPTTTTSVVYPDGRRVTTVTEGGLSPDAAPFAQAVAGVARIVAEK